MTLITLLYRIQERKRETYKEDTVRERQKQRQRDKQKEAEKQRQQIMERDKGQSQRQREMQERGRQEEGWKKKGGKQLFTLSKMYYINN